MSGSARPYGGGLETRIAELERKGRQLEAADLETRITTLEARPKVAGTGSVSLSVSPATSTVKTDANVTAASVILPVASNANGWSIDAGITGITAAAGSFTVTHSQSSLSRTFNYIVINPA